MNFINLVQNLRDYRQDYSPSESQRQICTAPTRRDRVDDDQHQQASTTLDEHFVQICPIASFAAAPSGLR